MCPKKIRKLMVFYLTPLGDAMQNLFLQFSLLHALQLVYIATIGAMILVLPSDF